MEMEQISGVSVMLRVRFRKIVWTPVLPSRTEQDTIQDGVLRSGFLINIIEDLRGKKS